RKRPKTRARIATYLTSIQRRHQIAIPHILNDGKLHYERSKHTDVRTAGCCLPFLGHSHPVHQHKHGYPEMNTENYSAQPETEPVVVQTSEEKDEAARKRAREFDDALYAPLDCRAQSDQARALVDAVVTLVTEQEHSGRSRTNRRNKKITDL